jgi:hypothetical protein
VQLQHFGYNKLTALMKEPVLRGISFLRVTKIMAVSEEICFNQKL